MKIVQTLWMPSDIEQPIHHRGGWLSPEYHWMAWALSCLLLKKHYSKVDLYTTETGKQFLIDQLNLPYSNFFTIPHENLISSVNWALSKLLTYSIQDEPFLHVDGDVFIWNPLGKDLLNSALIAQNAETDTNAYNHGLQVLRKQGFLKKFNLTLPKKGNVIAYNAGIIGGYDIEFMGTYARQAIAFVQSNLKLSPTGIDPVEYCMIFEQYFFAQIVKKYNRKVTTLFSVSVSDVSYPGFNNFQVMKKKGYWHLMGQFKLNRYNIKMMMSELRCLNPQIYYKILKLCKAATIALDFKVYELPELDPLLHETEYYLNLINDYEYNYRFLETIDWVHYYVKDSITYIQLKELLEKEETIVYSHLQFSVCYDFLLVEETQPILKQTINFPDTCTLEMISIELDGVNMILLDAIYEGGKTIQQLYNILTPYYATDTFYDDNLIVELINDRMYTFTFWGIVRWELIQ